MNPAAFSSVSLDEETAAMSSHDPNSRPPMSYEAFAMLGDGEVAYIKAIRSEDVGFLYADAPLLTPGHMVFVLHAADGTPIMIADSPEAAIADAASYRLEPMTLH
jgi:hypothetical protein